MNQNKYYLTYSVQNDKIIYQLKNHNLTIDNLINDIDKDTEFNYRVFYNNKYNDILIDYQNKVEIYTKKYNITITKNINDISYQLLLLLVTSLECAPNLLYSYDELKNKIQKDILIDNLYITDIFIFYKNNEYIENKNIGNKPKYLIYKSFNGFGDRLQCLLYAMNYCLITNRILVIDWTDDIWSTNKNCDFDTYFTLKDIPTMKFNDFKVMYNKNKNSLKVFPKFWKNNIFETQITNFNDICLQNQNTILNSICQNKSDDFKEDIIIYTGFRYRFYMYYLFNKHFIFNDSVLIKIYETEFYKNIVSKNINYCVIHLRGGDRMITSDNINYFLWNNNSLNENEYVDQLLQQIDDSYRNILLISDTSSLIENCYSKLKDKSYTIYVTNNIKQNTNEGLHKKKGISKIQINLEMLIDFYFMIKANKIINDKISAFSCICKKISYS